MGPLGGFPNISTMMQVVYLILGISLMIGSAPYSAESHWGLTYRGILVARTLGFVLTVLGVLGLKGLSGPLYSFSGNVVFGVWMIILGSGRLYMIPRDSGADKWVFVPAGMVVLSLTLGEAFWNLYAYF
jgi:hypothetical protein